jgi:hypothetical protein
MINSELLKEAIADAKAVRATALANAKAALEEAFAPRFEAMFAEKLKEESEEEEEEGLQEVEAPNQVSGKGGEAKGPATKAVTKGNPKQPKDSSTQFKAVKAGKGPADVANPTKKVNETAEEEEEEGKVDEQYEEEEEGTTQEAGLTSEDLDEIIAELESEVADEEEGKRADVAPAPEAPEGEVPPMAGDDGSQSPDGEVPPVAGADDGAPTSDVDVEADPEAGGEVDINLDGPPAGMNAGEVGGEPAIAPEGEPEGEPVGAGVPAGLPRGDEDDENINLEELLAALNEEADEEDEGKKEEEDEEMDEALQNDGVPTNELAGQDKGGGVKGYPSAPQDASKKQLKGKNHNISGAGNIGTGAVGGKPMQEQYRVALKEAYKTIEFLRGQINEVNLLNAKLLYTNKLFKEFAGVLDDTYRMKIVESFDLTKSVREVKLAYALLAESLNFGTQVAKTRSVKPVAKPFPQKGQVKQITEGFASKPVSSTKPSQLITEGNAMALRFKKLAGIKEAPKTNTPEKK